METYVLRRWTLTSGQVSIKTSTAQQGLRFIHQRSYQHFQAMFFLIRVTRLVMATTKWSLLTRLAMPSVWRIRTMVWHPLVMGSHPTLMIYQTTNPSCRMTRDHRCTLIVRCSWILIRLRQSTVARDIPAQMMSTKSMWISMAPRIPMARIGPVSRIPVGTTLFGSHRSP